MAGFQAPITIDQAMNYISNNNYLLPAFQREFVWKSEQIEKMFDSLMQGFPFGSMLFWKVKGKAKSKWKFYRFIDSFVLDARNYSVVNELYPTVGVNDFFAVLDGQQRLTAMRIGIYGNYAFHEKSYTWDYTASSFPQRQLYLCLSEMGGMDDECMYFFQFIKEEETKKSDFYVDDRGMLWFRVGAIVPYHKSGDEISDFFEKQELTKEQRHIIKKLDTTIFNELSVTYYEVDDENPDKAVKIFTRINSGGTFLNFSDIVFSLIVANWEKRDAKTDLSTLFNAVSEKGFTISKEFIVKAFLYLFNSSVKTEIKSFTKDFCKQLEDDWTNISEAILSLFDLLRSFGLTSFTLTSNNAVLPILYYIYHKNIYNDFTNKVGYKEDREKIKKWLYSAILRRTFGGQSDSTLQQSRKAFTEDISKEKIGMNDTFDGERINHNIKNIPVVDDELIESLLATQKDHKYAFTILALLYPNLDYKNNNFHKDHLHPDNAYKKLPTELREKYPYKIYNSILNLQMLDKNENESKGEKALVDWVKQVTNENNKEQFLTNHLIPNVNLELDSFDVFIQERKEMLTARIRELLI